ncbi:MASE1 domain-containing protein [Sphingomonas sp.]|uniref:MASE1 domain-containing protein n=1 Tax=Sphingomonas sp. TaxID=28214 RepID=UPI0035AD7A26
MQEPGTERFRWRALAVGIALSIGYCAIFLLTWRLSFNQWYLPAGLRTACLLLMPKRYWPAIFFGEASALLYQRVPKAEEYSYQWAYLSPFLFISAYSLVPYFVTRKFKSSADLNRPFPWVVLVASLWGCICAMTLNYVLMGPRQTITGTNFLSYTVGNYHGITMVLLPCLLWINRKAWKTGRGEITNSLAIATLLIVALYATAMASVAQDSAVQLMPLIFMILPVFYLTVVHGWHGSAVGTIMVNIAIALALPRTNLAGEFDGTVLIAQVALATVSGGLLLVGNYISDLFARSDAALLSELHAIQALRQRDERNQQSAGLLQSLFRRNELQLRENAILIAAARHDLDNYRHEVVQTLKEEEKFERAMEAHSIGVQAAKLIDLQRDYLYPLEIESHGLYAALTGPAFLDTWQKRTRIYERLDGEQRFISLPLRLAVYRSIIRAMESMQDHAPDEYDLRIRVWRRGERSGATVLVKCKPTCSPESPTPESQDALNELRARVIAYSGVLKRRDSFRLRFLMSEATLEQ